VTEYNRQLARLMDEVTNGTTWLLRDLVEDYGRPLVGRVLADGFGVVFFIPDPWSNEAIDEALAECRFLSRDDMLALVEAPAVSHEYRGHAAPGALDFQTDWKILRPYASDDPDAVAEVRRLHAERRAPAERVLRETSLQWPA
jgi:hypothetical protein